MSVPQQPMLPLDLSSATCATLVSVCSVAAGCIGCTSLCCAVPEHVWCTEAFASPGRVYRPCAAPVSVHLCCTWTCLCTRAFVSMLHLYVFFYAAPGRAASVSVCLQELCASPGYVYLQDPMLHLDCFGCLNTALKHRKN
jgi:hypothetical protein